jgi:general secretion pathway protein A
MTSRQLPLKHWGLDRWPFPTIPSASQFYPTAGHNEALARIEYLVDARRRLGVLLGEPGVGKSLLLRVAARHLTRDGRDVVQVELVGVTARELLWQVAAGLGAAPGSDADVLRLWRLIADRVRENRLQQVPTLLLLDDAGQAGPDVLTQLVRLARLDPTQAGQWTLLLVAEPGQARRWSETLREHIDLRIDLGPWEEADTMGYVQTALVDAGCMEPLFEREALSQLHELSGGVPRRVARLADFALLAGAATGERTIDASLIRAAHEETNWALAATLV